MAAWWRWTLRLLGLMVLLIIGLGGYLTVYLDPNDYRADLEQLAAEQGLPLRLNGNVSWTFWPTLGLSLEQVSLGTSHAPLLEAERMSARVALAPLLRQQLVIESILLDGAMVKLTRNAQGHGNWAFSPLAIAQGAVSSEPILGTAKPDQGQGAGANDGATLASGMLLQVARVTLSDLSLRYHDQLTDEGFELRQLNLVLQDFDLTGQTFQWQQSSQLQLAKRPPLLISTRGRASLDLATKQLQLLDSAVSLSANQAALEFGFKGRVDLDTATVDLHAHLAPVNFQQWLTQWQVELPPMAAADALNRVGLSAHIVSDTKRLRVEDLSVLLDRGQWLGHAAMSESEGVTVVLNGDQLDVDRYLPMAPPPPPHHDASSPLSGPQVPDSERVIPLLPDTPLPLNALRNFHATLSLGVGQLTAKGLPFEDVVIRAEASDGLLRLQRLAAHQDQGRVSVSGTLDARGDTAKIGLTAEASALQIRPLMQALANESRWTGLMNTRLTLASQGDTLRHWQTQAQGRLASSATALTITTLDIERSACELAALVSRKPLPELEWKNHTQFGTLAAELTLSGEQLTVKRLSAEVENLRVNATGGLDLRDGRFDLPMDVAFVGQADTERECQVRDRWRHRDLPLRCADRLATVSARSCRPDGDRLDDLLGDEVKARAQDKLKEKLQERLGQEEAEAVDQLLRGLFKRRD